MTQQTPRRWPAATLLGAWALTLLPTTALAEQHQPVPHAKPGPDAPYDPNHSHLGHRHFIERSEQLGKKSIHERPATGQYAEDFFFSGNEMGVIYELSKECYQVRLETELIFICPEGKYRPVIRNNRSGFVPIEPPDERPPIK